MSDRMNNIEMLLMLSDDLRAQGDDLSAEMRARGIAHAQKVEHLLGMLAKATQMLERERQRFSSYLPRENGQTQHAPPQQPPAPRIRKLETANG